MTRMTKEETRGGGREKNRRPFPDTQGARREQMGAGAFLCAQEKATCNMTRIADRNSTRSAQRSWGVPSAKFKYRPNGSKAYWAQKMVLTMGSTLDLRAAS